MPASRGREVSVQNECEACAGFGWPSRVAAMSQAAAQALEACLGRGVREFVVCAGARNLPLVLSVIRCEGVKVWSHFEERSAAFFALGRIRESKSPIAVITTSGTAVAELLPAVIEAHYQQRPLILITGDRPSGYRASGAPQAIEQVGIFGNYVEGCSDMSVEQESPLAEWSGLRPWHLNICLREHEEVPVLALPVRAVGEPRVPRPPVIKLVDFLEQTLGGLVVLAGGLEEDEREEVYHFLKSLGAPVLADATSGLREVLGGIVLTDGDALLRECAPGKVLRLGDVPVGRFWRDLESCPEIEVLSITRTGFSGLARDSEVITGRVHDVLRGMGAVPRVGDVLDLLRSSGKRRGVLEELLERYPDSEPGLVRVLSSHVATGNSLFLGNSLPIREWNLCAQTTVPVEGVQASRGANGIDGQLSAWLGSTVGHDKAWGIFGDLTVLYDLTAPAFLDLDDGRGRVLVVINNSGGRIFERLPAFKEMSEDERTSVVNGHDRRFESWASMWGLSYQLVASRDDFDLMDHANPLVLELRPDEKQTTEFWEVWDS